MCDKCSYSIQNFPFLHIKPSETIGYYISFTVLLLNVLGQSISLFFTCMFASLHVLAVKKSQKP